MSADEGSETASMPLANGTHNPVTPDPPALATPGKRKRGPSHDEKASQEASASSSQPQDKAQLHETLRNLVEVLNKNDADLHLLTCPLPISPTKPRSKRAKLTEDREEYFTIQSRVSAGRYNTMQEFLADIEKASASIIERKQSQGTLTDGSQGDETPLTEVINRIAAFKKLLNSLIRQASYMKQSKVKAEPTEEGSEEPSKAPSSNEDIRDESISLTLFGNLSHPKQLYSSLQKSVKVQLPSEPGSHEYVEVQAPLHEDALPNGITATKIAPYRPETVTQEIRKFGDVFAPRPNLPQLEPPRRSRSSARNAVGTWIDPFEAATDIRLFPGERNNYCLAPLPSGNWLQYGGVTSSPSYWNRRQKQSSQYHGDSDTMQRPLEESGLWAEDDASVLQGVYSSFAPTFDSSGAVVQGHSKDLVWWGKKGAKRLQTLLSLAYSDDGAEASVEQETSLTELDEDGLEELVKTFSPEQLPDFTVDENVTKEEVVESKEVNEMLRDVSELLETLSSYQKLRNLDPSLQNGEPIDVSPDLGTPYAVSDAEQTIYETLESSLVAILANLPPYAVAKLNGDQLAELNISQRIVLDTPDYRGTMEKDDLTLQQERAAAMAPSAANRNPTPNLGAVARTGSFQGSQGGYNQRAYAANTRVPQTPGAGFQVPQQYYSGRQPSASYTPAASHTQQYAGVPRAPATPTPRQAFVPPGYSHTPSQFNQPYQRQLANGYTQAYAAQQVPAGPSQPSPQPYGQRPGQPGPYNASFGGARSASPQKPSPYGAPQPRTPYMTAGANNQTQQQQPQPQRYHPSQPPPPQYTNNQPANPVLSPGAAYANSAAAITYARSAAEQAALIERTKAQLAANSIRQSSSSTPQQSSQPGGEYGSSQERSITPAGKPNGTPVPS
ncbi:hypothetical protein ASPZODRAFT_55194 [Penicilliopsis zonata CBS 506.65]|uniref:Uncharacterized protein n=1 Tax=Penicilliopsis zonata CBS 506.65 TaxID=1073090 RepID=A0A1L9SWV1_9EURO|nr:hypothetical protein ASPZODRAFT_55194 [Penicilliopsis zonata CBS 506.65]OJJ51571.1 hypothetical protein ASPZODRAFT_55194 [Penicilliopsis zonata CBS 506.65]